MDKHADVPKAGKPRRRLSSVTDESRQYTADQLEFMRAMDAYKRDNNRPFPTWTEVLEVLLSLGYRKGENKPKRQRGPRLGPWPVFTRRYVTL